MRWFYSTPEYLNRPQEIWEAIHEEVATASWTDKTFALADSPVLFEFRLFLRDNGVFVAMEARLAKTKALASCLLSDTLPAWDPYDTKYQEY